MRGKVLSLIGSTVCALGILAPTTASANNGVGDCHADQLQFYKQLAGTHSAEATQDFFSFIVPTVQAGQEFISQQCGQS